MSGLYHNNSQDPSSFRGKKRVAAFKSHAEMRFGFGTEAGAGLLLDAFWRADNYEELPAPSSEWKNNKGLKKKRREKGEKLSNEKTKCCLESQTTAALTVPCVCGFRGAENVQLGSEINIKINKKS